MSPRNYQRSHPGCAATVRPRNLLLYSRRASCRSSQFPSTTRRAPGTRASSRTVSSVYRLRQSRCFLESAGKLECATCHDPHRIPRGEEAVRHYSSVCLQCHSSTHPAGVTATAADCITCHMPKRRADDAPHVIMTDHFDSDDAPADTLAESAERPAEEYRGEVVPYHPSPLPDTPLNNLYRAVAQVGLGTNVAAGLPELCADRGNQAERG